MKNDAEMSFKSTGINYKSKYRPWARNLLSVQFCPTVGSLLGSAFPKPCCPALRQFLPEEVIIISKKYNTPHREHVIKTRLSEEEYEAFKKQCELSRLSQSEYLRKLISGKKVETVIRLGGVNQEFLDCMNVTNREIIRVGTNLNQIAHALNTGAGFSPDITGEIQSCIGELNGLRFDLLKKVGDAIGNDKAYRF